MARTAEKSPDASSVGATSNAGESNEGLTVFAEQLAARRLRNRLEELDLGEGLVPNFVVRDVLLELIDQLLFGLTAFGFESGSRCRGDNDKGCSRRGRPDQLKIRRRALATLISSSCRPRLTFGCLSALLVGDADHTHVLYVRVRE